GTAGRVELGPRRRPGQQGQHLRRGHHRQAGPEVRAPAAVTADASPTHRGTATMLKTLLVLALLTALVCCLTAGLAAERPTPAPYRTGRSVVLAPHGMVAA